MIVGVDIGNYSTKTSEEIIFKSAVSEDENLLGTKIRLKIDGSICSIGEGNFETELNKSKKVNYIRFLYTALALSSDDIYNSIVVGLPLNQYTSNKEALENHILRNNKKSIIINDCMRNVIIEDVKVYPEALGSYYELNSKDDLIIVDIGGRTTDIAYIYGNKLIKHSTINVGTLNVYDEIANRLNSQYTLNLNLNYIERILERNYLTVEENDINLDFTKNITDINFMKIKETLDLNYPAKSEKIKIVGGGTALFGESFCNNYKKCELHNDIFSNANGFKKVGEALWL